LRHGWKVSISNRRMSSMLDVAGGRLGNWFAFTLANRPRRNCDDVKENNWPCPRRRPRLRIPVGAPAYRELSEDSMAVHHRNVTLAVAVAEDGRAKYQIAADAHVNTQTFGASSLGA